MKKFIVVILVLLMISCTFNNTKINNYKNPRKALLVVDMQADYIGENGKYTIEKSQIENLVKTTNNIIDEFHNNNDKVIYLRNIFRKNDFKNRFRNYAVVEGTPGTEIDPAINIASEYVFDKYSPNAFTNTDFENFLIQNQINELYFYGVMADQCVYQTALAAFKKGYTVNYYINAVGSSSVENIEKATKKLSRKGINIVEY